MLQTTFLVQNFKKCLCCVSPAFDSCLLFSKLRGRGTGPPFLKSISAKAFPFDFFGTCDYNVFNLKGILNSQIRILLQVMFCFSTTIVKYRFDKVMWNDIPFHLLIAETETIDNTLMVRGFRRNFSFCSGHLCLKRVETLKRVFSNVQQGPLT